MLKDGLNVLNMQNVSAGPRTILVFGLGRGGTSAVAGVLRELGVTMFDAHPLKHESTPIIRSDTGQVDIDLTIREIKCRDRQSPIWGWKSPGDIFVFDQFKAHLRNPILIIVFRNILTASVSAARWEGCPWRYYLEENNSVMNELTRVATHTSTPILALAYEDLVADAARIVKAINQEAGIFAPDDAVARGITFVQSDAYRPISASRHSGYFAPEELDMDRIQAQERVLNAAASRVAGATAALRENIMVAQSIVEDLRSKLSSYTDMIDPTDLQISLPPAVQRHKSAPDLSDYADRSRAIEVVAESLYHAELQYRELDRVRTLLQCQMDTMSIDLR